MSARDRFLSLVNFGLGGLRSFERHSTNTQPIGIDLPLKALVYHDAAGKTWLDCPHQKLLDVVRVHWRRPGSKTAPPVIYLVAFARPIPHQGRFLEAASAILISLTRVKVLSGRAGSG
jgi:hypothetical protein